jgi:hypothetical protein
VQAVFACELEGVHMLDASGARSAIHRA